MTKWLLTLIVLLSVPLGAAAGTKESLATASGVTVEMAADALVTGTCPASIVCMPTRKVCASVAAMSSVVAARPTAGWRLAKCQRYATIAPR